ncbi:class I SAM-dependent methyltransferase [Pelosinus baikalensis]|uniref:Class I SAM-dependent methyltransferase n=1 Tax=Pelosinus baikalensis TaxID=2892015 RepID=A0ABS8HMT4_9FIRM|nr:class I SAM-dependent methyltransferase [Pelosinus baikalensis]MCC5464505.1 class I SAM-dependent methyltransferase [Pelosinus baikalensis]
MDLLVTTIQSPSCAIEELAQEIAKTLQVPLISRDRYSITALKNNYQVENIVVITKNGPIVHTLGGEYFFHLNMAELRIENLKNGKNDHMITAMSLSAGMSVLDCTLGLATDAIVASFIVGPTGKVIGIEASPILAFVASYGLQHFTHEKEDITKALRRIQVKSKHCHDVLINLPDNSFDVVFFDPMFRQPIYSSSNLKPLRYLADNSPIAESTFAEACRVARKRVVIKEASRNNEFDRLGITTIYGGKYSSIQYGVIKVEN